jgi:hypothetical protein
VHALASAEHHLWLGKGHVFQGFVHGAVIVVGVDGITGHAEVHGLESGEEEGVADAAGHIDVVVQLEFLPQTQQILILRAAAHEDKLHVMPVPDFNDVGGCVQQKVHTICITHDAYVADEVLLSAFQRGVSRCVGFEAMWS